jgi:hypothetical protein
MAKAGRKKKQIDASLVEKLAKLHLSDQIIADCCDCHINTIKTHFSQEIAAWRSKGKTKIAEVLFDEGVNKRQPWALKMLAEKHLGYGAFASDDPNQRFVFELNYSKEKLEKGLKKNET